MDDALLGTDPAQLAVVDEVAPCLAPVGDEGGEGLAAETVGNVGNGGTDNVVAATNGKCLSEYQRRCLPEVVRERGLTMP